MKVAFSSADIVLRSEAVRARVHEQAAVLGVGCVQVQERRHHRVLLVREVVVILQNGERSLVTM